jgi:hypothetical protein
MLGRLPRGPEMASWIPSAPEPNCLPQEYLHLSHHSSSLPLIWDSKTLAPLRSCTCKCLNPPPEWVSLASLKGEAGLYPTTFLQ